MLWNSSILVWVQIKVLILSNWLGWVGLGDNSLRLIETFSRCIKKWTSVRTTTKSIHTVNSCIMFSFIHDIIFLHCIVYLVYYSLKVYILFLIIKNVKKKSLFELYILPHASHDGYLQSRLWPTLPRPRAGVSPQD